MNADPNNPLGTPLSESRVHNRGLAKYVLEKAREYRAHEFRPDDLKPLVIDKFPAADVQAISKALSGQVGRGIERVGVGKTGLYRVAGTVAQSDDEAVLAKATDAIAALTVMIKRHRELLVATRTLKKAMGKL